MAATFVLNDWSGCFPESRSLNCIPRNEDEIDEDRFLSGNEHRREYLTIEEFGAGDEGKEEDEDDSFVRRLIAVELTPSQLTAAAAVVAENPQLLVKLYHEGNHSDELDRKEQCVARKKIFQLVVDVVTAMLAAKPAKNIVRALAMRRDEESGRTLLACFARFARYEVRNTARCHHLAATTVLKLLGYADPFARVLD
ncbi:MAG: hypothetical protein P4L67_01640 [Candidatus Pacebacteria bacterium]|nr:hypothetical protein [Candidatus Paceibacterota bacterium]